MARVTDEVRVEAVVAHRQRLRQAFLLGDLDRRREVSNGWPSVVVSVVLAAVACAGCVGYSFVRHAMATSAQTATGASSVVVPTVSEGGR